MMTRRRHLATPATLALGLVCIVGLAMPCFAAEKTGNEPAQVQPAAGGPVAGGQNVEKLLYTLNDTLEENRNIRQSMRDLQGAFEKVAIEKSDLEVNMRRVENQADQRGKAAEVRISELRKQAEESRAEIEKLLGEQKTSAAAKQEIDKKLSEAGQQNAKLREVLKGAVLQTERAQVLEQIKKNDMAVDRAVSAVAVTQAENRELREQLVRSYFDLGNTFYSLGRYEEAAEEYRHVLLWDPNHAGANHNLGVIYDYHFFKINEARYYYQTYLDLKPPGDKAHEVRLRLFELNQLVKLEPPYPLKKDFKEFFKSRTKG